MDWVTFARITGSSILAACLRAGLGMLPTGRRQRGKPKDGAALKGWRRAASYSPTPLPTQYHRG